MSKKQLSISLVFISILTLTSCSEHKVDTFQEWCEQISGEDLEQKYAKPWTVIFSVSFNGESIREDYANSLNKLYLEKVTNRAEKMAWREGTELHLINLSALLVVEPEKFIQEWSRGIELSKEFKHTNPADVCLFGTLTSAFDSLHIHTLDMDALGNMQKDNVTVIATERQKRLGEDLI